MNLDRRALLLAPLALAVAAACKPSQSAFDAGCNQAVAGIPDGSIVPTGHWTGLCHTGDLEATLNQLFGDAGSCQTDADCVFFNDAGPVTVDCITLQSTNPVALANDAPLQALLQGIIGSYCAQCAGDGGSVTSIGFPQPDPQSHLCLSCESNQCAANLLIVDAGS